VTTPPEPPAPVTDLGNDLIAPVLAKLHVGTAQASDGSTLGVVTVRTTSATVTAFLNAADVKAWADVLNGLAAQLGATSLVVPAPVDLRALSNGLDTLKRQGRFPGGN
jgi:hypothetical protein